MKSSDSHKIHLYKEDKDIIYSFDQSILEATLKAGVNHTHACGGQGKCSTCRVAVTEGVENCKARNKAEQSIADKFNFPPEIRLACQTKINADISIRRIVSDKLDMDIISEQFSTNSKTPLGSQQKLAIVFTDIINYTSFAEKFPAYDIVHILNRYYRIMNRVIEYNNGVINNVIGDGILAAFTPSSSNNAVLNAIYAIKEMNEELELFNKYLEENFKTEFKIRIGVHYGDVIVGNLNIGAEDRTIMLGDNVNYASRVESANKKFGTTLLLSEEAYQEVKNNYPSYNLFETNIKGKTGTYNLYEITLDAAGQ